MKNPKDFDPTVEKQAPAKMKTVPVSSVGLDVPVHTCEGGYVSDTVHVGALTERQALALKTMTCSLRENNARYQSRDAHTPAGLVVDRPVHAVKWLLDQIANGIEGKLIVEKGEVA